MVGKVGRYYGDKTCVHSLHTLCPHPYVDNDLTLSSDPDPTPAGRIVGWLDWLLNSFNHAKCSF